MLAGSAFAELAQYPLKALTLQDRIPDFSTVGYAHGDEPIPDYPVRETIAPQSGTDMTEAIQAAIDKVTAKYPDGGAVLLGDGIYELDGTLYDCCYNSAGFRCTDHGNSGSGHGWIGANTVFWNVETEGKIECESPWAMENTPSLSFVSSYASGRNYCIGLLGGERVNYFAGKNEDTYVKAGFPSRPDPQWYPSRVEYGDGGKSHVQLPCADAEARCSWWPRFSISSFDHPESLYLCQLQDRKAKEKKHK